MANTHTTLTSLFTAIADAIRAKTGGTGTIVADEFPTAIANISGNDLTELKYARGGVTIMSFNIDVSIYKQLYINFRVFNLSSSKISNETQHYRDVVNVEPQTIFSLSNVWNGANSSNIVLAIDENNQLVGTVTGGTGGSQGTQFQIAIVGA